LIFRNTAFIRPKSRFSSLKISTQDGNKRDFFRNKNHLFKPQRGDINIAWGSAPGNPSYDHVEYNNLGSITALRYCDFSLAAGFLQTPQDVLVQKTRHTRLQIPNRVVAKRNPFNPLIRCTKGWYKNFRLSALVDCFSKLA
jgi:hypothetical protein